MKYMAVIFVVKLSIKVPVYPEAVNDLDNMPLTLYGFDLWAAFLPQNKEAVIFWWAERQCNGYQANIQGLQPPRRIRQPGYSRAMAFRVVPAWSTAKNCLPVCQSIYHSCFQAALHSPNQTPEDNTDRYVCPSGFVRFHGYAIRSAKTDPHR